MVNPRDDFSMVERYDGRYASTVFSFDDGDLFGRMADGFRGTETVAEFAEERVRPAR